MCWKITKKDFDKNPESYHKIADEDIFVYKIGEEKGGKFFPFYMSHFAYYANSLNEEIKLFCKISLSEDGTYEKIINKGYHSYSGRDMVFVSINSDVFLSTIFYQFKTLSICKFIIPKGTEYYENDKGEIVSSQLIWIG